MGVPTPTSLVPVQRNSEEPRISFDGTGIKSERVAYSTQLSPIAQIQNMISPQLKASRKQGESDPKLLFIALQEYFEQGSRCSNKADRIDVEVSGRARNHDN